MVHTIPSASMREQSYPPPYPDGWYQVARSADLKRGSVRYLECLGQALVLYRSDEDDSVHAMAAFCPHLGANLAGGCVKSGNLECPFHRWQLCGEGKVVHIPYAKRLPVRARQQTWPVIEQHGMIFLYHRGGQAEGRGVVAVDTSAAPPYALPSIGDIDDGRLV